MKKNATLFKSLCAISLLILASFTTLFAQVPEGISYQAVARDASGAILANQNLDVIFEIRETGPSGTVIYDETHAVTTNDFGLFTATIGTGTVGSGTFNAIAWGGDDHFLRVLVDLGSGPVNMGTTQLLSVPYSMMAKAAEKATNMTVGELTDVNVGSPTNGQVLKWNGSEWIASTDDAGSSPWTTTGTDISYTAGSVGIGINNPSHPLHIVHSTTTQNTISIEAGTPPNARDVLELKVDAATSDDAQFIEMERGTAIVASINTDGSAKFKSVEFEDGTVQNTASIGALAFGFIETAGTTSSGSGNYTSTWNSSSNRYEITITGESYFWKNYSTTIAPTSSSIKNWRTGSVGGKLLVYLYNSSGTSVQENFQFITFK